MIIRTLTYDESDIRGLTRLMNQWDDLPGELTGEQIRDKALALRDRSCSEIFLCEKDREGILGYACALEIPFLGMDPFIELQSILVDREHRGRGIGNALLDAAEAWARDRGFGRIMLSSRIQLENAHKFYKKRGYEICKQSYFFLKNI